MLGRIHAIAAIVFVVAIVVQVFFAGAALVNLGGSGDFTAHREFGYTGLGIASVVLLVTALIARRPRRDVAICAGLLLLYVVQTLLPNFRTGPTWLAALHPVNALFLFGAAAWYARHAWRATSRTAPVEGG
jgi:uncharacterized protein DUF6220